MADSPEPHTVGAGCPGARELGKHRLGPHVVGERVVVRHLLPDGRATDVLGTCTSWGEDTVTIESDRGPVAVAIATIVTGKPVPPRASVRSRVPARDVELHVASLWDDQVSVPLGEWVLRTAPPYDGRLRRRANSALAMGDPGVSLAEASQRTLAHYREHDRQAMAQVEAGSEVETGLLGLGWRQLGSGAAECQLAPISRALRACNALSASLAGRRDGLPELSTVGDTPGAARLRVEAAGGTAQGEAALDGDWLGLHGLHVDPEHRRQGLAHAVLAELLDWGASLGAVTAWLHVEVDNAPARALYEPLGFVTHHAYRYLVRADG